MNLFKLLTFLSFSLFAVGCGIVSENNTKITTLRFGGGGNGGVYHTYGTILSEMIAADGKGYAIDVRNSVGSIANVRLLNEKIVDIALVQSDILSDAVNNRGLFASGNIDNCVAISGIYTEACQIIVPADSTINKIEDLVGREVSVGERESGTRHVAEQILKVHGITLDMIKPVYSSYAEAATSLERGDIDAFFVVAGFPTPVVTKLANNKDIRLLSIDPQAQNRMTSYLAEYIPCIIPANSYSEQTSDVSTIGVKLVLVATADLPEEDAEYLTDFLFRKSKDLPYVPEYFNIKYAAENISIPFHLGAAKVYDKHNVTVNTTNEKNNAGVKVGQD